jgi:DNA-binding XRE family transcriptional regulator
LSSPGKSQIRRKVKQLRAERNLTQPQLARAIGIERIVV